MRSSIHTLAISVAVAGCAQGFAASDEVAIRGVLEAQASAWNAGDVERFMAAGYLDSEDLVFTAGGEVRRGYASTLARYRERYRSPEAMGHLELSVLEVTALGGDGAVVLGRWALSGTAQPADGVFTLALVRTQDGWRIVHDHTSVAKSGPTMAEQAPSMAKQEPNPADLE